MRTFWQIDIQIYLFKWGNPLNFSKTDVINWAQEPGRGSCDEYHGKYCVLEFAFLQPSYLSFVWYLFSINF